MRTLVFFLAASAVLPGQSDPGEIIRRSVAIADRGWRAQQTYKYTERDEERHLDSHGSLKSGDVDVSQIVFINGLPLEQTIGHNGGPPTSAQRRKDQAEIAKLKVETSAERTARIKKEYEDRAFIREVPDAFHFQLTGEDLIDGRPAWVLEATPIPGYRARGKYAKMFSKVRGKLWVDKQDYGWVKVEATVTEPFSMGLFLARIQRGSHIRFEQTRVAPGIWLPKQVEVLASAKILFFVNYNTEEFITFSNYQPARPAELASAGTQGQRATPPSGKYRLGSSQ